MKQIRFSRRDSKYACFSNFWACSVTYNGITYQSSEAAWQSLKTLQIVERYSFCNISASEAKKRGRRVTLRPDWEDVKFDLMVDILMMKFAQHPDLAAILKSTGDAVLIEDTTSWHDNEWGDCSCPRCRGIVGQNKLGQALMIVRSRLR